MNSFSLLSSGSTTSPWYLLVLPLHRCILAGSTTSPWCWAGSTTSPWCRAGSTTSPWYWLVLPLHRGAGLVLPLHLGTGWFYHFTVVLVFTSSCINPLIYAAKYREFQQGVKIKYREFQQGVGRLTKKIKLRKQQSQVSAVA